jgi:hypothetical protein
VLPDRSLPLSLQGEGWEWMCVDDERLFMSSVCLAQQPSGHAAQHASTCGVERERKRRRWARREGGRGGEREPDGVERASERASERETGGVAGCSASVAARASYLEDIRRIKQLHVKMWVKRQLKLHDCGLAQDKNALAPPRDVCVFVCVCECVCVCDSCVYVSVSLSVVCVLIGVCMCVCVCVCVCVRERETELLSHLLYSIIDRMQH